MFGYHMFAIKRIFVLHVLLHNFMQSLKFREGAESLKKRGVGCSNRWKPLAPVALLMEAILVAR